VVACAVAVSVTGVGLILMTDSGPAGVVAATDEAASTMEKLQFGLGEGPCVDSSVTGRPALHPDLARTGPALWPVFSAGALEAGIGAIFAFPLRVGAIRLGVLDLYRDEPGHLTSDQLAEALSFAGAATTILLLLETRSSPLGSADADRLDDVIGHRAVVHQATGLIAVQAKVSLAAALSLLRAASFSAGRSMEAVGRDVVDRALRFDDDND